MPWFATFNRIAVMYRGKIVEIGTTEQITRIRNMNTPANFCGNAGDAAS